MGNKHLVRRYLRIKLWEDSKNITIVKLIEKGTNFVKNWIIFSIFFFQFQQFITYQISIDSESQARSFRIQTLDIHQCFL